MKSGNKLETMDENRVTKKNNIYQRYTIPTNMFAHGTIDCCRKNIVGLESQAHARDNSGCSIVSMIQ